MAKQIIYGIGKAILRDYKNRKKVIGFADLQDLSVESTMSKEDITGGNKMFPIASFKNDQALSVSATSATFNDGLVEYLDGADVGTGAVARTGFKEVAIPSDGNITLDKTPIEGSIVIPGYSLAASSSSLTTKQYSVEAKVITFATADAGDVVNIIYEYNSSEDNIEYSVTQKSIAKPFEFDYIFEIYDEDSQISHEAEIRIYKAQSTSGFKLDAKHRSPFAPQFEAEAKDAQRADGKLWSLFIDGIEVGA